ncbi:MAG TPA: hypothetical protein PKA13_25775 [Geminicoccaceae bacterium]|nr:hypothetical protein [Geminicoccus sp.]HMU53208.1 hypothetical protein [Geminicoccaceae bacterium]
MDRSGKPRKRRIVLRLGLLALALLLGWWLAAAPVQRAWARLWPTAQDHCRIGSVTPERYAEIVAEVTKLPPIPWERAVVERSGPNPVLAEYFRQILTPIENLDIQIATIHAILRHAGAEYTWVSGSPNAPLPDVAQGLQHLTYNYNIDIWHIGLWRPVLRSGRIVVTFSAEDESQGRVLDFDGAALLIPALKRLSFYDPPSSTCTPNPDDALTEMKAREASRT